MSELDGEHTGNEATGEHATQGSSEHRECRRCERHEGLVSKYGIFVCRQCFREIARSMGFRKYR
ncbi:30S ribosomal protein S14 [Halolamina sp.]|jgi:small subunit ribosomal protein S14|uniref:30S ribosomal protein S14 n=1 Tax=Halolamina sp. TaxID=1940283 RepID=UPI000223BCAB|nr:ribosomal protein S14 [halophilic archaeon DL31]